MTDNIRDAAEALLAAMDGATDDFAAERAALRRAMQVTGRRTFQPQTCSCGSVLSAVTGDCVRGKHCPA
jgi:hypothetical protein